MTTSINFIREHIKNVQIELKALNSNPNNRDYTDRIQKEIDALQAIVEDALQK